MVSDASILVASIASNPLAALRSHALPIQRLEGRSHSKRSFGVESERNSQAYAAPAIDEYDVENF